VIVGLNRVFPHEGHEYHLQVEDLGAEAAVFEIRVYEGGSVTWRKRVDYHSLLAQNLPREELEAELRRMMEKYLHTVEAAIAKGRLGA
jgi:hypothetical protein